MEQANAIYQRGDWKGAGEAYGDIVRREPANGRAWYRLGASYAKQKQFAAAIEAYLKAEAIGHQLPVMYGLAAAYAQSGDTTGAFAWLEKASANGLRQARALRSDADFEALRALPHFAAVLAQAEVNERPCAHRPEWRQLNFWIGDWTVKRTSDGTPAGTNRITLENNDCTLYEHWAGIQGDGGQSTNYYNATTRRWHQSWIDDQGQTAEFDGEFRDGAMRLEGYREGPNGTKVAARLTLTPLPDGSVRQVGEDSADAGKTWTPLYDLTYVKRK
jgi:tetratricopeptide (TPR) repeat protein